MKNHSVQHTQVEKTVSTSEKYTKALAEKLGRKAKISSVFCLFGDLGSGKTTFVRGFAKGFGVTKKHIQSPTFTFFRVYRGLRGFLYHFDCYRLAEKDNLIPLEIFECMEKGDGIIMIEWAQHIKRYLPKNRIEIHFRYVGEKKRIILVKKQ